MQNYDIVIKSHQKDYEKLPYVIDSLENLNPMFENIYIVSPDSHMPKSKFSDLIIPINDNEVVPKIDKSKFNHRYNWCWVNTVSLTQEFTKNDMYFDVQSDNIFLKKINLFNVDGKPKLFKTKSNPNNNEVWSGYFSFSKKMFDIEKITLGSSYIIEFMMYDKNKLSHLYKNYKSKQEMIESFYDNVSPNSYPADQEIYGNMIEKYFPDSYEIVNNVETYLNGDSKIEDSTTRFLKYIDDIKSQKPNSVACSYHTYWMPEWN